MNSGEQPPHRLPDTLRQPPQPVPESVAPELRSLVTALLERVADTTPDLLFVFDLDQRRNVYANQRLDALFGLTPAAFQAIPGDQTIPLIHPEDLAHSQQFLDDFYTASDDEVRKTEHRIRHPDGNWRWLRIRACVFARNGDGRVYQICGVTQDITSEKQTELALRESEARYRQLADAMPQLVWTSDAAGTVDYYNSRVSRYAGVTQRADGRWSWSPIVHPDDLAATQSAWQAAQQSESYEHEHRLQLQDGSYRWHLSRAQAIRNAEGQIVKWFGTATDIHDRKRVEALDRFLYQLLDATRTLTAPEAITATVAHMLGQYMSVDRCAYAETEPDQNHFVIIGQYTRPGIPSIVGRYAMHNFGDAALRLMRHGQPFVVEESASDPRIVEREIYSATQIAALICVPLQKDGRFVAGMAVHQRTSRRWTADEIELVRLVANLCWEAIARIHSEHALRASEERYRSLVRATTSLVWTTDANGAFVEPQPDWEAYTGQPWQTHQGWGWVQMLHPDDRDPIKAQWTAAIAAGGMYEARGRVWHAASTAYRYFVTRATPVVNAEGSIREWIGTLTDIHPQRLAEQQAQQAARRTERLQHVTAGLSAALTPDQVAAVVVEQSVAALGAALGSLRVLNPEGTELVELHHTHDDTRAAWRSIPLTASFPLTDAVRSGQPIWLESLAAVQTRYPDLVPLMQAHGYSASASLPVIVENRVLGVISLSFAQPHTFSPEDQSLLLALVQQCGQALERARLYEAERQARTEAEAAVAYRDQFLSVAAHELRTPLTTLLGNAQLLQRRGLRDGGLAQREQRTVRIIVDQASRLNRLVQALLDITRLERGQLTIEQTQLDLCALLHNIVDEMQASVEGRSIDLICPDAPLLIRGDALRLEQAFQNLIQNALKYSAENTAVQVQVTQRDGEALIDVVDHGIGIPPDELARLFQRFYRARNAEQRRVSGMGIGLYVVKEIVTLHGGSVAVTSMEGRGSTFTVSLPRA